MQDKYRYVIIGGGLAAASAVAGIRERDTEGTILVVSRENHAPYHRPPLSKGLWTGKEKLDGIAVQPDAWYAEQHAELSLRREIVELDPEGRQVWDDRGATVGYEKLLLATGGRPRPLDVPGGNAEGVHYYRSLEDYLLLE